MAAPNIDPKRTALILCDFQNGLLMSNAKYLLGVGYRQDLKALAPKAFTPGENWGSPELALGNVEQQIVEGLTPEPGDFIAAIGA